MTLPLSAPPSEQLFDLIARLSEPSWPAAVRWPLIDALATRIGSYAAPATTKRFATVTSILRRPADVLDAIDREARRLYSGDRSAAATIRMLLDPIAAWAPRPSWSTTRGVARVRRTLAEMRRDPACCRRVPGDTVVDPVAMPFVAEAVDYSSGPGRTRRQRFASALDFLWRETERLDALLHVAEDGAPLTTERLDVLLRANEALVAGAPGLAFPQRGRSPDATRRVEEMIRAFVVGAGKIGLSDDAELPTVEVYAGSITSLAPNPPPPGELLTLRGTGFGVDQPAGTEVVLDGAGRSLGGIPLEIVRWSDRAIEVRLPDEAGPGCIGFRQRNGTSRAPRIWQQRTEPFDALNLVRRAQGAAPLVVPLEIDAVGFLPSPIPCTGRNRFLGVRAD